MMDSTSPIGSRIWARLCVPALSLCIGFALFQPFAHAQEFNIGEPVVKDGLKIVPNYLLGIEMDPMPLGMAMGPDTIHLEVDVHAATAEPHGFAANDWIPYLTVHYRLEKAGDSSEERGQLFPMTAKDGPHYANNVSMHGPGKYHLTYVIDPPSSNGFIRHIDKATGVPNWWAQVTADWTFDYPSKAKEGN